MLGIIIVNYNDWDNLRNCIDSIETSLPYRIYIVDNASNSNIYSEELKKIKNIRFIQSEINGGYSYGNNLGLKFAISDGCDFFLISNTDIVFKKDSIDELIKPLMIESCDIIGPKVILSNGNLQEEILGVRVNPASKIKLILNSATYGFLFKTFRNKFNNVDRKSLDSYIVYGVSGCCFAFNRKTFEEVLPFDEEIFLYNEEWLLSEKSFLRGLRTKVNNKSIVLHNQGSTTKNIKLFSYVCFISSEYYLIKTFFPANFFLKNFILCLRIPKLINLYFKERLFEKL